MNRLSQVLLTAACSVVIVAPTARADASRLGTPEVVTTLDGESHLIGADSAAGHGDAYAIFRSTIGRNTYLVAFEDQSGRVHRFTVAATGPAAGASYPQAVRLVALEGGGGMAVWDESTTRRVLARSWSADGTLSEVQTVLSDVTTVASGDSDVAEWQLRSDGAGTVVVATTGAPPHDPASVFASVRDPGGAFGPPQELTPPGESGSLQRQLTVSPIAADGTVDIAWAPNDGMSAGGRARRTQRAPRFGPAEASAFVSMPWLTSAVRAGAAPDSAPIALSARLARLCPCFGARVFRWDGVRVLAFQRFAADGRTGGDWYVARPGADGSFDRAERATQSASSLPVRRQRPGEVGFARFDGDTDFNLFRQRSRLVVVPFGPQVARSTRAPALRYGTFAGAGRQRQRLLMPVFCDRVCTVSGGADGRSGLPLTDFTGHAVAHRLEPFTVAYVRVPLSVGQTRARVRAEAVDDAGHRAAVRATFVRHARGKPWCISTRSHC